MNESTPIVNLPYIIPPTPLPAHRSVAISPTEWDCMKDQAKMFLAAGCLPQNITKPEQAMVIILKGRELGIPPMASLSSVFLIKGTPAISAQLMLALCYRDIPGFEYEIIENTETKARIKMRRPNKPWGEFSFSLDEAKAAGLGKTRSGEPSNWDKYPKRMLLHRAVSFGCRSICPDAVLGSYTPEEAEEFPERDVTPPEPVKASPPEPVKASPPDYLPNVTPKVTAETFVANLKGTQGAMGIVAEYIARYCVGSETKKYAEQLLKAATEAGMKFEGPTHPGVSPVKKVEPEIAEAELFPFEK